MNDGCGHPRRIVQFTIIYPPAAAATEIANSAPNALRPAPADRGVEEDVYILTYLHNTAAAVLAQLNLLWGPFFGEKVSNCGGGRTKKDS